jgi:hypothetical protein
MTRQEFKDKLVNRLLFVYKIKDKQSIDLYKNANFKTIILHYIQSLPLPSRPKEYNNQFVWIKMISAYALEVEREESNRLHRAKERYKKFIKDNKIKTLQNLSEEQYHTYISLIDLIESSQNLLELYQKQVMAIHYRLEYICNYYDKIDLSFHEFVGLCGLNMVNATKSIRDESNIEKEHKHWSYLFNGIEDANEVEGWKSNRNGMPLQNFVFEAFLIAIDRNKKAKQKMDDFIMHNLGFAQNALFLKENEDGSQSLEKYYPPLKIIK